MTKTLWTPWRMEHVTSGHKRQSACLFEPSGDAVQDREQLLLYRDQFCLVLLNRFPYANGHLLVAPRRHLAALHELETDEQTGLMTLLGHCTRILEHHLRCDGFNIGLNLGRAAGAGIPDHLHLHVVPRWQEDHNFMTVLAEVRTIPQHIMTTFDLLAPDFLSLFTTANQPCPPLSR